MTATRPEEQEIHHEKLRSRSSDTKQLHWREANKRKQLLKLQAIKKAKTACKTNKLKHFWGDSLKPS